MTLRVLIAAGLALFMAVANAHPAAGQNDAELARARRKMVDEAIIAAGVKNERVIQAMLETPRHEFVSSTLRAKAYFDMALPIGEQQTISSPFIVAYMTESLDPQPEDRVLEIGTGSGYQAAVLSPLVREVYTIEIVESLGRRAERTLRRLGYKNVHAKVGDGFQGWPEHAPFDKIIVTCSPEKVPDPLVEQLAEGGLMVIPVGERYQQTLYLMRKRNGRLQEEALRPTLFVPMTGRAEEGREVLPDPTRPEVVNGGFEEPPGENGFLPGWYYERQQTWETDPAAPEGDHFVTFRNREPGQAAHLLQGFPIDGASIRRLELSGWVRHTNVVPGRSRQELPWLAVTLYDGHRKELGNWMIGPFQGDSPWRKVSKTIEVPPQAREGILRVGLFGAVGEISFDDVRFRVVGE
jgi:protein-L-isoaspartate(D-aspartate) O-methyltransferase